MTWTLKASSSSPFAPFGFWAFFIGLDGQSTIDHLTLNERDECNLAYLAASIA